MKAFQLLLLVIILSNSEIQNKKHQFRRAVQLKFSSILTALELNCSKLWRSNLYDPKIKNSSMAKVTAVKHKFCIKKKGLRSIQSEPIWLLKK